MLSKFFPVLLLIALFPALSGCGAKAPMQPVHPGTDAILWAQTAAEYEAAARQCYDAASRMLPHALAHPGRSAAPEQASAPSDLPPAVILDVDETVLDNTRFNAKLVLENRRFSPDIWAEWVTAEMAGAIPGALGFIEKAEKMGIAVFYITNRSCPEPGAETDCPQKRATLNNLSKLGFPRVDPAHLLLKNQRPGWGSEKAARRAAVAESHRILMIIGDDLGDFMPGVKKGITREERKERMRRYGDRWGRQWFILPNPVYGSWKNILPAPETEALEGFP